MYVNSGNLPLFWCSSLSLTRNYTFNEISFGGASQGMRNWPEYQKILYSWWDLYAFVNNDLIFVEYLLWSFWMLCVVQCLAVLVDMLLKINVNFYLDRKGVQNGGKGDTYERLNFSQCDVMSCGTFIYHRMQNIKGDMEESFSCWKWETFWDNTVKEDS